MARILTTPISTETIYENRIVSFGVSVARNPDGTLDNDNTYFNYVIVNVDDNGNPVSNASVSISKADWATGMKDKIKSVYDGIITDAESRGLYGTGTDENDIV